MQKPIEPASIEEEEINFSELEGIDIFDEEPTNPLGIGAADIS